jgi:hypothetical protein
VGTHGEHAVWVFNYVAAECEVDLVVSY